MNQVPYMSALCACCLDYSTLTPLRRNTLSFCTESCWFVNHLWIKLLCLSERSPAVLLTCGFCEAALSWRKAYLFIIGLPRRGTFPQIYSFTICNNGSLFFYVELGTTFNHAHPFFSPQPHLSTPIKHRVCSSCSSSGKVKPARPCPQEPPCWPHVLITAKPPTSQSHFLALLINTEVCLGSTKVLTIWVTKKKKMHFFLVGMHCVKNNINGATLKRSLSCHARGTAFHVSLLKLLES